jgi:copper chaperone CopZ
LERPVGKVETSRPAALAGLPLHTRATRTRAKGRIVKTTTLRIEGMHCDGCAETLQFLLGREEGVRKVEVSFDKSEARILHDTADEKRFASVVRKAGFRVAGNR